METLESRDAGPAFWGSSQANQLVIEGGLTRGFPVKEGEVPFGVARSGRCIPQVGTPEVNGIPWTSSWN